MSREEQRVAERKARDEQYRAETTAKQKIRNDFSSQYGHLGVASEEEIDEKLQALEFSQQHESLTIAEEKAVLKQIRQLQVSSCASGDARAVSSLLQCWICENMH